MAQKKSPSWLTYFSIISVTVVLLKVTIAGFISPEYAAIGLFLVVVLLAVGRNNLLKALLAIFSLSLFIVDYGNGNDSQMLAIGGSVLALILMLYGIYIMISGFFR